MTLSPQAIIGWHLAGLACATAMNAYSYFHDVKKRSRFAAVVSAAGLMVASMSVFLVEIILFAAGALPEFGVAGELLLFVPSLLFVPLNLFWTFKTLPVVIQSGRVRWYRAALVLLACLIIGVGVAG